MIALQDLARGIIKKLSKRVEKAGIGFSSAQANSRCVADLRFLFIIENSCVGWVEFEEESATVVWHAKVIYHMPEKSFLYADPKFLTNIAAEIRDNAKICVTLMRSP